METKDSKPYINMDYFENLTGDICTPSKDKIEEIGKRIRSLRTEKGISIQDLSNMTGFDIELLSQIENSEVQPQLGTIMRLSKALDSAFGRLVSGVGNKLYSVTRKAEQKTISRSTSQKGKKQTYVYKALAPEVKGRHMEALIVGFEENPEGDMSIHGGEEFIHVLEGTVTLKIAEDIFDLEPGDSVYYLSTTPHLIASKKGKATILAVIYDG